MDPIEAAPPGPGLNQGRLWRKEELLNIGFYFHLWNTDFRGDYTANNMAGLESGLFQQLQPYISLLLCVRLYLVLLKG